MRLHFPAGSLSESGSARVAIDPAVASWDYSGLQVVEVPPDGALQFAFPSDEVVLLPLLGSFEVDSAPLSIEIEGRDDFFHQLTDRVYLPPDTAFTLKSEGGGEMAICTARAGTGGKAQYRQADDSSVEIRGSGQATRQVNGIWTADDPGPERLIVVEVLTPAGNWSSYPPHKHDEESETEVPLEEIYYYRISGDQGFGFHRTYTADESIDATVTVRDGDTFLIPRGFHGPCVAAPGYDMYYLNVMSGPVREWRFSVDPSHEWVQAAWSSTPSDPRLPMNEGER